MNTRIVGALLIVGGCSGAALRFCAAMKREEDMLKQLCQCLLWMECALSWKGASLTQLFEECSLQFKGILSQFFADTAREMQSFRLTDAHSYMELTLENYPQLPCSVKCILQMLSKSLGEFDLDGQLRQLAAVRIECERFIENTSSERKQRQKIVPTLGLCAGSALAILLL